MIKLQEVINSDDPNAVLPINELQQLLAKQIKMARVAAGLTQDQLAAKAGLSRYVIVQLESGESNVTISTLLSVSIALGMVLDISFHK